MCFRCGKDNWDLIEDITLEWKLLQSVWYSGVKSHCCVAFLQGRIQFIEQLSEGSILDQKENQLGVKFCFCIQDSAYKF